MKIYGNVASTLLLVIIGISSAVPDKNAVLSPLHTGFKCSPPTDTPKYACSIDGFNYTLYSSLVNRSVVVPMKYLNSSNFLDAAYECFATIKIADRPQFEFNRRVKFTIEECALPLNEAPLDTVKIQPEEKKFALKIRNHYLRNEERYSSMQHDEKSKLKILYCNVKTNFSYMERHLFSELVKLNEIKMIGSSNSLIESNVFSNQPNYGVFTTRYKELLYLSPETFKEMNILRTLDLSNRSIVSLHQNAFLSFIELTELDLSYNMFETLPDKLLSKNEELETFRMNFNERELTTLPNNFFADFPLLKEVHLRGSQIRHLPKDVFKGSKQIETLDLGNNDLRSIPETLLRDQQHLKILRLNWNKIASLPNGVFSNTQSLQSLMLAGNRLSSIKEGTFGFLPNLLRLHLDHNKLQFIDPSIFYRTTNFQSSSSNSSFESINQVNPHKSKRVSSAWKNGTTQLEYLDLSYNYITHLPIANLRFPSPAIVIDLSYNRISLISMQQLQVLHGKNIQININNNPLNCDCNILSFIQHLHDIANQNIKFFVKALQCTEPRQLQNVHVAQLQLKDLVCPLMEHQCPQECTCSFRSVDTTISINCSNQGLEKVPELPSIKHFNWTTYELHITGNSINTLPASTLVGYSDVTALYLDNNSIEHLSVDQLSHGLNILNLAYNKLTELDEPLLQELNQRNKLKALWLSGNQWRCDCSALQFINYVQQNRPTVQDVSKIKCHDGRILDYLTANDLCFENHTSLIIIFIALSTCALLIGITLMLYYKHRIVIKLWLYNHNLIVTEDDIDRDKPYDAFISYSYKDEDFVANHLIPTLESEPMNFNVCWHMRDWIPGELIPTQITQSIENSRRTIIVLSQNFLESFWGQLEFRAAHLASMAEKRVRVIVIMYGEINIDTEMDRELQAYLKTNIYLKWGDPWFWNKLNDVISDTRSIQQHNKLPGRA